METKQTAVDCFYEGLFKHVKASSLYSSNDVTNPEWVIPKHRIIDLLEFCKKMHKEEIGRAYQEGLIDGMNHSPKDYYNETYNATQLSS